MEKQQSEFLRKIRMLGGELPFNPDDYLRDTGQNPNMLCVAKRACAANMIYFNRLLRYAQIFSLCRKLDITNIYDIGCGSKLQSFLLLPSLYTNYTGIDPNIFHDPADDFHADPEWVNGLFREWTGCDRIRYIQEKYPCRLDIRQNNIAILFYALITDREDIIKNLAQHLAKDFERVFLTLSSTQPVPSDTFEAQLDLWKKSMPEYEFFKIGEPNLVFATRIPVDAKLLAEKYTVIDHRILTELNLN